MPRIRCRTCTGSGKVMGGGMMMQDCDDCDGYGKIEIMDKSNTSYQDAKQKIVSLGMKEDEAEKILDKELMQPIKRKKKES